MTEPTTDHEDGSLSGYKMLGSEAEFEALLIHLRDKRGFDFTG